jgi:hypothetical protein
VTNPANMGLSKDEREQFLTWPHIDALSVYAGARRELGEHVAIYMQPQRWLSADLGLV